MVFGLWFFGFCSTRLFRAEQRGGYFFFFFAGFFLAAFFGAAFTKAVNDSWGWYLTLVALILVGIVAQIRQQATWRRSVHETWYVENA